MAPYRSLDHIVIRAKAAEPLYTLFGEAFGLPVSWPLQHSGFASFGWVNVGNTNLEIWASASNADLPSDVPLPLVQGLALNPEDLQASIARLAQRGIECKAPKAFRTQKDDGTLVDNFTNSVVLDVSSDACCVFFCAWSAEGTIYPWKEKLDAVQRKARDEAAFGRCAGGALGLVGLAQIRLAVPDVPAAEQAWRALTGSQQLPIALTPDIALHIVAGARGIATIESLTFGVRSLAEARAFLSARHWLEGSAPDELVLSRSACEGLDLRFIEVSA
ncbi:VOC family protein [Variovorax sp. W2I14]|uniref:VOC family protein n=1 Tax=Variovorax sp. W2I14 TaxID=3042290 RepID=UPI003D24F089